MAAVSGQKAYSRKRRKHLGGEEGQALVEFALVVGLLAFLLFSVLELGLALNARLVLTSVARETARNAAVSGGRTPEVVDRMKESLRLCGIDPNEVDWTISPGQAIYGTRITVRLSYSYRFTVPLVSAVAGRTVPISVEVVTRSEFVPR